MIHYEVKQIIHHKPQRVHETIHSSIKISQLIYFAYFLQVVYYLSLNLKA